MLPRFNYPLFTVSNFLLELMTKLGANYSAAACSGLKRSYADKADKPVTGTGTNINPPSDSQSGGRTPRDLLDEAQKDVRGIDALDRTIEQWRLLVDWNLQRQRPMVVIDPNDPDGILYLTERDYRDLQKVCLSNDMPLTVIARPQTPLPQLVASVKNDKTGSSQNTPPSQSKPIEIGPDDKLPPRPMALKNKSWSVFHKLKSWIPNLVKVTADGLVGLEGTGPRDSVRLTTFLWGRETLHYCGLGRMGYRMGQLAHLGNHLTHILRHNGAHQVILRLKVYLFVLNAFVGGERISSTADFKIHIRLRNGLPEAFPQEIRSAIRSGSIPIIRWWASVLNMYKAFSAPYGTPDLSSVTTPKFSGDIGMFSEHVIPIWESLIHTIGRVPIFKYNSAYGFLPRTAGPRANPAFLGMAADAMSWMTKARNYPLELMELWGDTSGVIKMQEAAFKAQLDSRALPVMGEGRRSRPNVRTPQGVVSKLAYILEAAGKIRVVAVVDYWTHMVCKPLHDFMLGILRDLPTDATYDQTGSFTRYMSRCEEAGRNSHHSFDLKAATDTIPSQVYVEVLTPVIGRKAAELWMLLLTDREFFVPKPKGCQDFPPDAPKFVRYTRGQPMGALSSWPALALGHHFIVQAAARQCGWTTWFPWYEILGDDIDIADDSVAARYEELCAQLLIILSKYKSLKSVKGLANFANQTILGTTNISPVSLKEELKAKSWASRVSLARRILSRWDPKDTTNIALIRRVVPVPLWNWLQTELSRSADVGLLRTLELITRNPLAGASELDVDNLLQWLQDYLKTAQLSGSKRLEVVRELSQVFREETVALARPAVEQCKKLRSLYAEVVRLRRRCGLLEEGHDMIWNDLVNPWLVRREQVINLLSLVLKFEFELPNRTAGPGEHDPDVLKRAELERAEEWVWDTPFIIGSPLTMFEDESDPSGKLARRKFEKLLQWDPLPPAEGLCEMTEAPRYRDPQACLRDADAELRTAILEWLEISSLPPTTSSALRQVEKSLPEARHKGLAPKIKALFQLMDASTMPVLSPKESIRIPVHALERVIIRRLGVYPPLALLEPNPRGGQGRSALSAAVDEFRKSQMVTSVPPIWESLTQGLSTPLPVITADS